MRRAWTLGLSSAQLALLVGTYFVPGFGAEMWHHVASLGIVIILVAVARRPLASSRRVLAIGALVTSVLAIVSGFYLLYGKEAIRPAGYQDWGVWWHVAWSWAAAVFFFQHTWINRVQFVHFFRQSAARAGPLLVHVGAYVAVLAALAWSWSPLGKGAFQNGNYLAWGLWTWLAVLVPAYAMWLISGRGADRERHWRWRRGLDLALVPMAALATLSGLPLLFLGDLIDPLGLKYASKYWHTAPSIVFTVLVFAHSVQVWSLVRRHWAAMAKENAAAVE